MKLKLKTYYNKAEALYHVVIGHNEHDMRVVGRFKTLAEARKHLALFEGRIPGKRAYNKRLQVPIITVGRDNTNHWLVVEHGQTLHRVKTEAEAKALALHRTQHYLKLKEEESRNDNS